MTPSSRRRALQIAERVRNAGAAVFGLAVVLLLVLLLGPQASGLPVGDEEGSQETPAPTAWWEESEPVPAWRAELEEARRELEALDRRLRRGEIDAGRWRKVQQDILSWLADRAVEEIPEDAGEDLPRALLRFAATLQESDRLARLHYPYFAEPLTPFMAWSFLKDVDAADAALLERELFTDLSLAYFRDVRYAAEFGYLSIPTWAARDLGYPDYASFMDDAEDDPNLLLEGLTIIGDYEREMRQARPDVEARLILWHLVLGPPFTPEAAIILEQLKHARGLW